MKWIAEVAKDLKDAGKTHLNIKDRERIETQSTQMENEPRGQGIEDWKNLV